MISCQTEYLRHCRVMVFFILVLVVPAISFSSEQMAAQVEVEGYASIVSGRKDQAREAAIQNAFRRAVEQVVGVAIESKTVVKDSELLNDKIFSRSKGLIKTYRIVSEHAEPDAYRVTVLASVSQYRLEQELDNAGVLVRKLGKPRIAIVVMENNVDAQLAPGGVVETYLAGNFARKGYNLVDRQAMLAVERVAAGGASDHTDAVVRAAAAGGAEVVIIGQARAQSGNALAGTSMRPVQVSASSRVVEVDTGEVLASLTVSKQALNVNPSAAGTEALHAAAVELSDGLDRQLVTAWNRRITGLRSIRLTISGVQFASISKINSALKEQMALVEDVNERGYKESQLRLELQVTGSSKTVVDELSAVDIGGVKLLISGFSGGHIQARWPGHTVKRGKRK